MLGPVAATKDPLEAVTFALEFAQNGRLDPDNFDKAKERCEELFQKFPERRAGHEPTAAVFRAILKDYEAKEEHENVTDVAEVITVQFDSEETVLDAIYVRVGTRIYNPFSNVLQECDETGLETWVKSKHRDCKDMYRFYVPLAEPKQQQQTKKKTTTTTKKVAAPATTKREAPVSVEELDTDLAKKEKK